MKRKPKRRRLGGPIHARIAELREKRGLTQEQLAMEMEVDKTAVSHWENGVARPDMARLSRLAIVLDTTIETLLDGERAA